VQTLFLTREGERMVLRRRARPSSQARVTSGAKLDDGCDRLSVDSQACEAAARCAGHTARGTNDPGVVVQLGPSTPARTWGSGTSHPFRVLRPPLWRSAELSGPALRLAAWTIY
jgi:hypothetical protein